MFECICYDEKNELLENFWQYDTKRKIGIEIIGYSGTGSIEVQFATKHMESALSVAAIVVNGVIKADVPDIVFTNYGTLNAYVCENGVLGTSKTVARAQVPIKRREKPELYIPDDPSSSNIATVEETRAFLGI